MRIITGEFKGRRLYPPADRRVRPTSDMIKEALFSMVAPWLEGAVAVDLFTGTGNLGLEAISRGAGLVYFADIDRESINLTKKNIAHCGGEARARVLQCDWERALDRISGPVDIFFLDPPYGSGLLEPCLRRIGEKGLLAEDGVVAAEHGADKPLPEEFPGLSLVKKRKHGTICISLYQTRKESDS
ncbi:MAG: 16S rRNA (guanine(966)-N(2))-methyltransferase RsmD [Bacillota bacterium]|nr:16S rRNA (guanine(966)-N(2))-methyltransferase RsmD [Bacillota bacterium]